MADFVVYNGEIEWILETCGFWVFYCILQREFSNELTKPLKTQNEITQHFLKSQREIYILKT